jgi:hypothetical protein
MAKKFTEKLAAVGLRSHFYAVFQTTLDVSRSRETALVAAIKSFSYRDPFNVLLEEDVLSIAKICAPYVNCKKIVGGMLVLAKENGTAMPLKDPAFVRELADKIADSGPKAPDTPEENLLLAQSQKEEKKPSGCLTLVMAVLVGVVALLVGCWS